MKKQIDSEDDTGNSEKKCEFCGGPRKYNITFNFGGRTLCPNCLKKTALPLLILLVSLLTFSIILLLIWIL